jgi:hypothetical protein
MRRVPGLRFLVPLLLVVASVAVSVGLSARFEPDRGVLGRPPDAVPPSEAAAEPATTTTAERAPSEEPRPGDPWPAARREEADYVRLRSGYRAWVGRDPGAIVDGAYRRILGDRGTAPKLWSGFVREEFGSCGHLAPTLEALTQLYPESPFADSFAEYAAIRGGEYFGDPQTFTVGDFKYDPEKEIPGFVDWLQKYPGHPGQDDACYRIARCETIRGDMTRALSWFRRAQEVPDGDMERDARCWELLLLDALLPMEELRVVAASGDREALYSLGVRLFRRDETEEAERCLAESLAGGDWDLESAVRSQLEAVREVARLIRAGDLYALGRRQYHDKGLYSNHLFPYGRTWHLGREGILYTWGHDGAPAAFREEYRLASNRLKARRTFLALAERRPGPELEAKARFSATTALGHTQGGHFEQRTVTCPERVRIRLAEEYRAIARDFPESSLADDALVFSGLYSGDPEVFLEVGTRYPNGDMAERAEREYERARARKPLTVSELGQRIERILAYERGGPDWRTSGLLDDLERHLPLCVLHIRWLRDEARKRAIRALADWFEVARARLDFDPTVGAYVVR